MNILVLVSHYPDEMQKYRGVFFQDQVNALSLKHHTILVYPYVSNEKFSILPKYILNEVVINNNLKEIRVEIFRSIPVYNQFNYFLIAFKLIFEFCRREKIEIIHGHSAYPISFLCYMLSKSVHIPYCITEHSSDFHKAFRTRIHKFIGLWGLRHAHGVFSSGEFLGAYLRQLLNKEVKVLHNTINLDKFKLKNRSDHLPFNIGFLGILSDNRKGLDLLLEALSQISLFDFVLHIGGDGKMLDHFKLMASEFGIKDKCIFYGSVDPDDVPVFFSNCNIFVLPSRAESFGVVVIEAMASGLPVIATRCGGPEYLITEGTGIIIEKENIAQLKDAITRLFEDLKNYSSIKIQRHAQKWDYNSFTEKATGYYEEIIKSYQLERNNLN